MCEDWITEKYIDDVRNANQNNYAAIKRVRELTQEFWDEDMISLFVYLELMKVLNGKTDEA